MDVFSRERELCELFIRNRRDENIKFTYDISNKAVEICVHYKKKKHWRPSNGESDLNRLWRNFNLAFIGYKEKCLVLNYRKNNFYLTEYLFPMIYFNIDNFHSLEFKNYESGYYFFFNRGDELFQSFKSQLDRSFDLYKQNNLAITKQEEELRSLKYKTESAIKSYNAQMEQCQKDLESNKREIDFQRNILMDENFKCNEVRRRFRYFSKQLDKVQQELSVCETSVAVSQILKGDDLKK